MNTLMKSLAAALVVLLSPASAQNYAAQMANGTTGSIDVPYNVNLIAPTGGLTAEAWLTYNDSNLGTQNRFPTIIRNKPASGWSYFLRVNAGTTFSRVIRFAVVTTGGQRNLDWTFSAGQLSCWTHLAATYDNSSTMRLYVNGVQAATATFAGSGPIVNNNVGGTLVIGEGLKNATLNNEVWNGKLDRVRVWSTALTQAQVQAGMFTSVTSAPNLVAAWHMEGNLVDVTGNGNSGTMYGSFPYVAGPLPSQLEYQSNSTLASLTVNGLSSSTYCLAQANVLLNQSSTLVLQSTMIGYPFDLAVTIPEFLVPASAGGLTLGGGQIINMNLGAPSLFFAFGTPAPFANAFGGTITLPFASPVPITAAMQFVVINPTVPDGVSLSGGVNFQAQ